MNSPHVRAAGGPGSVVRTVRARTPPASAVNGPHRRHNPLLDEWVLCSPHRLERPWQGQQEVTADEDLPAYDPSCYLCPGNARAGGQRNPAYGTTFAFDNDFPALLPRANEPEAHDGPGLLRAQPR